MPPMPAGSYVTKQYTILTAGSISGSFGSLVNSNLPANFTTSLSYDAKDAYLNLALNFTPTPPTPTPTSGSPNYGGLNGNQQAVGNALINFFNTTGGIPLVFGALTPTGLSQVSGETATGSQQTTFNAMTPVHGRDDGSLHRRPCRWHGAAGRRDRLCRRRSIDRRPHARMPMPCSTRRRPLSSSRAGAYGLRALAARRPPMATRCWDPTTRPAASTAPRSAPIIASRRIRSQALRSPAAAPVSASPMAAAAGPTCSRPAPTFATPLGRLISPAALAYGWQDITTNRTVTAAGIDQLRARIQRQRLLRPGRRRLSLRFTLDRRYRRHALRRRTVHDVRSAGLCRAGHCRLQRVCARLRRQGRHGCAQ